MTLYAIVDTETTGLGRSDRIVEVAVVLYDADRSEVVDELDTLINPMRDIGPTDIHGLTPSMVSAAPTFDEVVPLLAERLDGSVLVAHNLAFDTRMLLQEFERLAVEFDPGLGVCTLQLSNQSLAAACERHGIAVGHHHRALADARAATELLRRYSHDELDTSVAFVGATWTELTPRTLRRDLSGAPGDLMPLRRLVRNARFPTTDGPTLSYLDALDWVLDDLVIDDAEREHLAELAAALGLDAALVDRAHRAYFRSLVVAAQRDHIITLEEHDLMRQVAALLGLDDESIPEPTDVAHGLTVLQEGTRVCFTGTAVIDGVAVDRADVEEAAAMAGLQPVASVTKQCDLLVCADTTSMSKKAATARKYGIPVMNFDEFIGLLGYVEEL